MFWTFALLEVLRRDQNNIEQIKADQRRALLFTFWSASGGRVELSRTEPGRSCSQKMVPLM